MGAKTGLLMYADGDIPGLLRHAEAPGPDRTSALVRRSYPDAAIERWQSSTLYNGVYPPPGRAYAGSWPGLDVLADRRLMIDSPSQLPEHLVAAGAGRRLVLHAMHSVVDWLAFAVWEDGHLLRSLSLSPDSGVIENIGTPLPFEQPYWAGDRPADVIPWPGEEQDTYPLPSTPWSWARTPSAPSAASSRRGTRSRKTSTRRPSASSASARATARSRPAACEPSRTGALPRRTARQPETVTHAVNGPLPVAREVAPLRCSTAARSARSGRHLVRKSLLRHQHGRADAGDLLGDGHPKARRQELTCCSGSETPTS